MRPPDRTAVAGADRHDVAYADLAAVVPRPVEGECLICFSARASAGAERACMAWQALEAYRLARAPAAAGLPARFRGLGAACACGLSPRPADGEERALFVVARAHRERDLHTDELRLPDPLPACHGVRPGSAQPCGLWVRGPRRRPGELFGCSVGLRQSAEPADSQARCT